MEPLKFSIITISYNHAEFIEDTIRSVRDQDYENVEHIVIDGGSTDETISILERYPHLNWVSEKDRGISNALNKGLKKATGDVIAWINSDDWYARNIFGRIAELARTNPVIMGDAVETDRAGNSVRTVKNYPRTFYDLQKYWVPLAWLAQPSVFFTREALESAKLPNGDYIDETFNYSMDYDLWLRMARRFPFTCHVDEVFSYFRIYGENATGRTFASPQRELGRAFRRSMNAVVDQERSASIVIPVQTLETNFIETLQSLVDQAEKAFDVLLVDGLADAEHSKRLKDTIHAIEEATTQIGFRIIKERGAPLEKLIDAGLRDARSSYCAVIRQGDLVRPDFMSDLATIFGHDTYGAALFLNPDEKIYSSIGDASSGLLVPNSLLSLQEPFIPFAVRLLVLNELGGFSGTKPPTPVTFRAFLLRAVNRGWLVKMDHPARFSAYAPLPELDAMAAKAVAPYVSASLFVEAAKDVENDIFYPIRSESPYTLIYPKEGSIQAEKFLKSAPENWAALSENSETEILKECTEKYPYFVPGWIYYAKSLEARGSAAEATACLNRIKSLRPDLF